MSPADFNERFADWLGIANQRVLRTLGAALADRLAADEAAMLSLPSIPLHWRLALDLNDLALG